MVTAKQSPAERQEVFRAAYPEINTHDIDDIAELKTMLPATGWFPIGKYGKEAAKAAFLIVQYSPDLKFQEQMLARMTPLLGTPDLDGQYYGMLWDRVELFNHRTQRFGSQVKCVNGVYTAFDLEDPAHVNERRKAAGFKKTEEEYMKGFATDPCRN